MQYLFVAHTVERKGTLESQIARAAESYYARTGADANVIQCHASEQDQFVSFAPAYQIQAVIPSKDSFWIGRIEA